MLRLEINPPGVEEEYLRNVNRCFTGWGDRRLFRWCFERTKSGPHADLMILSENGDWLAASGISYRALLLPNGQQTLAGIMTASFTLPASRGKGCFSRIVEESLSLTRARGCGVLLGFVQQTNASCRRLAAAGSALFPSYYLVSGPGTPLAPRGTVTPAPPSALPHVYREEQSRVSSCVRIGYPDLEGWISQMVERVHPCALLELGEKEWALVEEHPSVDRVLFLAGRDGLGGLLRRAQDRGRTLFLFTMDDDVRRLAVGMGLTQENGFLAALVADPVTLGTALGCDMPWTPGDSTCLAEAKGPWFLGGWAIHGGDRM